MRFQSSNPLYSREDPPVGTPCEQVGITIFERGRIRALDSRIVKVKRRIPLHVLHGRVRVRALE